MWIHEVLLCENPLQLGQLQMTFFLILLDGLLDDAVSLLTILAIDLFLRECATEEDWIEGDFSLRSLSKLAIDLFCSFCIRERVIMFSILNN